MYTFKFVYTVQGGHTHANLFAGPTGYTLGKCGTVVFRNEEFEELKKDLSSLEPANGAKATYQFVEHIHD